MSEFQHNQIVAALQRRVDFACDSFYTGGVSMEEAETLNEMFAEPGENVGVWERRAETARRGDEGPRALRRPRGSVRPVATVTESTAFPPMTNRGVEKRKTQNNDGSNESPPSQDDDFSNVPFYGGYDGGCEIGYYGDWVGDFIALREELKTAKEAAGEKKEDGLIELGGLLFYVRPTGGSGEVRYSYILDGAGLTVMIHNNPKNDIQPVRVRFGFESLHGRNFFDVVERFGNWLNEIGFEMSRETLSRIDLQVTLATAPKPLFDAIQSGCCVARARAESWNGKRGLGAETYTLGKKTQVCIYDKLEEMLTKRESAKLDSVLSMFPGGALELTRVEFRLRRDALKEININTINDLKECEKDLIEYLTQCWFRIVHRPYTKGNANRYKNHPLWSRIIEAFTTSFGLKDDDGNKSQKKLERRKRNVVRCDATKLEKQVVGVLSSARALVLGVQNSVDATREYLFELAKRSVMKIHKLANERAFEWEVKKGFCSAFSDSLLDTDSPGSEVRRRVLDFFKEDEETNLKTVRNIIGNSEENSDVRTSFLWNS